MFYTLLKFLGWGALLAFIGGCIGWALRSLRSRGEVAQAKSSTVDEAEVGRMRHRLANLEQVVAERDRLRIQLADVRHADSPGIVGAEIPEAPEPEPVDERSVEPDVDPDSEQDGESDGEQDGESDGERDGEQDGERDGERRAEAAETPDASAMSEVSSDAEVDGPADAEVDGPADAETGVEVADSADDTSPIVPDADDVGAAPARGSATVAGFADVAEAVPDGPVAETGEAPDGEPAALDLDAAASVLGRSIEVDDLTVVEGIGPKISELCRSIGITTWRQLADADVADLQSMLDAAGSRYAVHKPGTWSRQAELLATSRWAEFQTLTEELGGGK